MPSLAQILSHHRALLVFDAASLKTQVGLLRAHAISSWQVSSHEAGRGIFTCTEALLKKTGMRLEDVDAFAFCEGPGSMLGIRTVAMALRTWQVLQPRSIFAFQSLSLAGHFEWTQNGKRDFSVIADARREMWHLQEVRTDGQQTPLQRVASAALSHRELLTPENFRAWATPAHSVKVCRYDLTAMFGVLSDADVFHVTQAPENFQHESPEYKKSPAQIHRLPAVDKK